MTLYGSEEIFDMVCKSVFTGMTNKCVSNGFPGELLLEKQA